MSINVDALEKLMPNVLTVVTQLAATIMLFLLMKKLVWEKVKAILDKRSEYEQSLLTDAERLHAENEKINAQAQETIEQANIKAQEIIEKASAEAVGIKDNMILEGKEKSAQLIKEAQQNIELQKKQMLENLHEEIVNVALTATEKMLQEKLENGENQNVVDDFIDGLNNK